MIEQETASIIKYVLDSADNPAPYYHNVPESFVFPATYFPVPEILTRGETLRTYACEFDWYIKFFHKTTQEAYQLAYRAMTEIVANRRLVPLIKLDGSLEKTGLRIIDPSVKAVDDGAAQLYVRWTSRRPYNDPEYIKMVIYHTNEDWLKERRYQEPQLPAGFGE